MHLGEPLPEERLAKVEFNYGTLLLFFCVPYALMMWTNGIGASTGMFVPALAVGATGLQLCTLVTPLLCQYPICQYPIGLNHKVASSDSQSNIFIS